MRRIAIIGSGISGLAVAHRLAGQARVTLFEAGSYLGGHTHTVDLTLDGHSHGVDTGFLVFNGRCYPKLIALFAELGIATAPSDMSFSVQAPIGPSGQTLEWNGASLNTVFAQRGNLLRPRFWRMLGELLRFNRLCSALADGGQDLVLQGSIGEFLDRHRFSADLRDWYLLPMLGCIWSCPTGQMQHFPAATMIRFCHNHGLLQVADRPQWFTVPGGARQYVRPMVAGVQDLRLNTPVRSVRRLHSPEAGAPDIAGVWVGTDRGGEYFDDVVLACHSDQALALLADPSEDERRVLGAIGYQRNRALLHTDTSLLPQQRRAWAAWNYAGSANDRGTSVCLHYLLNKLQPLPFEQSVLVSLNPIVEPAAERLLGEYVYEHPIFDQAAIDAQRHVCDLQGRRHTWFCGAWTRYGFHEDGLSSGLAVAKALRASWARTRMARLCEAA